MSTLLEQINYAKAYRKNRLEAAQWVLENPETLPELIAIAYHEAQEETSHKALWVLEFVVDKKLELLFPHFDAFFNGMCIPTKEQSVRPLANIGQKICIAYYKKKDKTLRSTFTAQHKEKLTECCFDWIIQDKKVACSARAMTCLDYLGTEIDWIHPELKVLLEQKIHTGSAGYKNCAAKIIKKISEA